MTISESTRLATANSRLTRRAVLLGGVQLALVSVIAGRLVYLQGIESEAYHDLAEANRIDYRLIVPNRGMIHDRKGIVLAQNIDDYTVELVQEQAGDVEEVLKRISLIIPIEDDRKAEILAELHKQQPYLPVLVADRLTWEQFVAVSINLPALPGTICNIGKLRKYPLGDALAHVIGYVGPVTRDDLEEAEVNDPILRHPNFRMGKTGLERGMDEILIGKSGHSMLEVNVTGRIIRELENSPAVSGSNLQLTIDSDLQTRIIGRMGDLVGVCTLLDLLSGDILALVATPSFDPNKLAQGISQQEYDRYINDSRAPLFNRATRGTYPPGSTFKMMSALAALEAGTVTPDQEFFCNGHYEISNRRFHCWNRHGHGQVDLHKAIAESCDVYFYRVAELLGINPIVDMATRFGFGRRADLPLAGIAGGLMPTGDWKQRNIDEPWHVGDTLNASIGQGFVTATCLQIAIMTARVALGTRFRPRLVSSVDGVRLAMPDFEPMTVREASMQLIRDSMHDVVNTMSGTAFDARTVDERYLLSGKTGTSQVARLVEGVEQEDLPWEQRDHALFCAYAPHDRPRYAVATIIEHGGQGSRVAAPIARDVLLYARYGAEPPLRAYPEEALEKILLRQREEASEEANPDESTLEFL